ncbi:unnamed protein product, partial [Laminaria digitata]
LSQPSSTTCCTTDGGITQAHTAREHVGSSARNIWTLRRTLVEVFRGADPSNPPQDRETRCCSQAVEATPTENMRSSTSRLMNLCGKPASRSATKPKGARASAPMWTAISVLKEALSGVMVPPTRQGAYSESAREG